jgi:hypothetical protein
MHMSLPFCQMSYISVCCGYIFSCTDPVLPTVDIHMSCQTYHIVCKSVFQGDILTENYASFEKYQYFATSQMFGMSTHHSLLKCVILSTVFHSLPILSKEPPMFGKWRYWRMLRNLSQFATERHDKVQSTTSSLPLSPMYHVSLE